MPEIPDFWIIFPNYLHSLSLNDGVEEFVVLCHLLRSYNFWLTGVTFVVIQQGNKSCGGEKKGHLVYWDNWCHQDAGNCAQALTLTKNGNYVHNFSPAKTQQDDVSSKAASAGR